MEVGGSRQRRVECQDSRISSRPVQAVIQQIQQRPLDAVVAYAIVSGILDASQIPDELLEYLSGAIAFYKKEEPGS